MRWCIRSIAFGLTCLLWVGCGDDDTDEDSPTGPSASQLVPQDSAATFSPPIFALENTAILNPGAIWCVPNYDGNILVVSTEAQGKVALRAYDFDLNPVGDSFFVAGPEDTHDGGRIADHKHIFQNDHHYLTFSTAGTGQGGWLYLAKFDINWQRIMLVTVASNDAPTNDMLLVGDGTLVNVGKFRPGEGHRIYTYGEDLNLLSTKEIGGGENRHSNGAASVFWNGNYHLVAPSTLAPGKNDVIYHIVFDTEWNVVTPRHTILNDPGQISLVTDLGVIDQTFVVHYTRSPTDEGGPVYQALYDDQWNLLSNTMVLDGKFHRPHSVVVLDRLFLGYDGVNLKTYLSRFSIE